MIGLTLLQRIGTDLGEDVYPVVHDGGIVEPALSRRQISEPGKETFYGEERTRGSAAGKRERTTGGSWPSGRSSPTGSGSTCTASSFLSKLNDEVLADLLGVAGAYRQVRLRATPDLVWLLNCVTPIRGLDDSAILITAYPLDPSYEVTSWAWWGPGIMWIGPRHTNFVGGSVCAFQPKDGTWYRGQPLIKLIDLQVLWVVRHLYLREFDYWPGRQELHAAYERLRDHRPREMCGCDSGQQYEECCRERDERMDPIDRILKAPNESERKPPSILTEFVFGHRKTAPFLPDLVSYIRRL